MLSNVICYVVRVDLINSKLIHLIITNVEQFVGSDHKILTNGHKSKTDVLSSRIPTFSDNEIINRYCRLRTTRPERHKHPSLTSTAVISIYFLFFQIISRTRTVNLVKIAIF